jgi:hypothetical protein
MKNEKSQAIDLKFTVKYFTIFDSILNINIKIGCTHLP